MEGLENLLKQILQEIKELREDMNNGFGLFTKNQDETRAVVEQIVKTLKTFEARREN